MVDVENPETVWEEVRKFLTNHSIASITDLNRELPVNRNWLAGFLAACEAFGLLRRKGTKTFKLYELHKK